MRAVNFPEKIVKTISLFLFKFRSRISDFQEDRVSSDAELSFKTHRITDVATKPRGLIVRPTSPPFQVSFRSFMRVLSQKEGGRIESE